MADPTNKGPENKASSPDQSIGFLYVITHKNANRMVKIGITQRPEARMRELEAETIWARVLCFDPRRHEQELHKHFSGKRLPGTEWFQIEPGSKEFQALLSRVQKIGTSAMALCTLNKSETVLDQLHKITTMEQKCEELKQANNLLESSKRKYLQERQTLQDRIQEIEGQSNKEAKHWQQQYELERGKRIYSDSIVNDLKLHIKALEGRLSSLLG